MSRGPAPEPSRTTGASGWPIGMELRTARERLGWDLPAVSAGLRIKLAYLTAIEEGRLGALPSNSYAARFLRTYAVALGLDPDELSRRLGAETADGDREAELTSPAPAPTPERGVRVVAVVLVGALVLAIAAFAGWSHFLAPDRQPVRAARRVPARPAATAGAAAAKSSPQVASVPPAPAAAPSATRPTATIGLAAPSPPDVPPTQAAASKPPQPSLPPAALSPAAPAKPAPAGGTAESGGGRSMILRASADTWVQVRQKDGRVLLNRVMRPGETWPVPADQPDLLLSTGNAGGTELEVDGVTSAPLGSSGAVLHDLPLDPALAKRAPPGSTAPAVAR